MNPSTKPKPNPRQLMISISGLNDTDRLNALFTLFGGYYAFHEGFELSPVLQKGRRGIDEFIAANPSLLGNSINTLGVRPMADASGDPVNMTTEPVE